MREEGRGTGRDLRGGGGEVREMGVRCKEGGVELGRKDQGKGV